MRDLPTKPPKVPGTYFILDDDKEKVYVGSTSNLYQRYNEHRYGFRHHRHENNVLQKHHDNKNGELSFVFLPTPTKAYATAIEQLWLDALKNTGMLCNVAVDAKSSMKGLPRTDEQREQQRQRLLGRKHSEESKRLMSEIKRKHDENPEYRDRVSKGYRKALEEGRCTNSGSNAKSISVDDVLYPTTKDALRSLNIAQTTLYRRIRSDNYPSYFRP